LEVVSNVFFECKNLVVGVLLAREEKSNNKIPITAKPTKKQNCDKRENFCGKSTFLAQITLFCCRKMWFGAKNVFQIIERQKNNINFDRYACYFN
jgi:hypothetical protein